MHSMMGKVGIGISRGRAGHKGSLTWQARAAARLRRGAAGRRRRRWRAPARSGRPRHLDVPVREHNRDHKPPVILHDQQVLFTTPAGLQPSTCRRLMPLLLGWRLAPVCRDWLATGGSCRASVLEPAAAGAAGLPC